jgi:uncharacterized protein (TIGR03067 family)
MRTRVFPRGALAAGLIAGAAAAAPVPKHLMKPKDDSEQGKLQGKWRLTAIKIGGMELGGGVAAGISLTVEFRGEKAGGQRMTAKIKLDVVNGVKRCITCEGQKLDPQGKPAGEEKDQAFGYKLEGDQMTWAIDQRGMGQGPLVDPANPGPNAAVFVFTRMKEKED